MLERFLAALAPSWALSREMARRSLQQLRRGYDAARNSRRTRNWRTSSGSANAEVLPALKTLRDRSRDLVRNNPYAAGGLDTLVSYQVGTGIIARSATGDEAVDRAVDTAFAEWSEACDLAGMLDYYGHQALAARTRSEAGESLTLLVRLTSADMRKRGLRVPLALQAVEPDHIDDTRNEELDDGGVIRAGIECDRFGARRAYHLFREHPGEGLRLGRYSTATDRVPADQVLHVMRVDRAGQLRGVPDLVSAMMRLRSVDELEDAALEQAKVQACLAAFVTSSAPQYKGPLEGKDPTTGDPRKTMAPGIIERLLPGEDVKFATPQGGGSIDPTVKRELRAIAVSMGLTYDLLTGDLSDANYSSLRAGRLAFKRRVERMQWQVLIPQFVARVMQAWATAAQAAGVIPTRSGPWPFEFSAPAFEHIDPEKEAAGIVAEIRAGLRTWQQAVAERGYDPRRQAAELGEAFAMFDALGIVLDIDARRINRAGAAQDAKANSAVEIAAKGGKAASTSSGSSASSTGANSADQVAPTGDTSSDHQRGDQAGDQLADAGAAAE